MGRSAHKKKTKPSGPSQPKNRSSAPSSAPASTSIDTLLAQAAQSVVSFDYPTAKEICLQALHLSEVESGSGSGNEAAKRDVLEVLATVEVELGELEQARQHFLICLTLPFPQPDPASQTPPPLPSPHPHLYLAQLSPNPQECLSHYQSALEILSLHLDRLLKIRGAPEVASSIGRTDTSEVDWQGEIRDEAWSEEEREVRRNASRALVGMAEVFLTDLCFDPSAPTSCESYLSQSLSYDPTNPEIYSTMSSVRLSQERKTEARLIAEKGWQVLRRSRPSPGEHRAEDREEEEDEEEEVLAPRESRLSYAQLFLELGAPPSPDEPPLKDHADEIQECKKWLARSIQLLTVLCAEDDEDPECEYLRGWGWWLLAGLVTEEGEGEELKDGMVEGHGGEGTPGRLECWVESRGALEVCLSMCTAQSEDLIDPTANQEMIRHVQDLLGQLEERGVLEGPPQVQAGQGEGEGGDWEDVDEDEDEEMS